MGGGQAIGGVSFFIPNFTSYLPFCGQLWSTKPCCVDVQNHRGPDNRANQLWSETSKTVRHNQPLLRPGGQLQRRAATQA